MCWLAFFTHVFATSINLINVLQNTAELSTLYSYVNASSNITRLLLSANNFTFLAPSNDAIAAFIKHNPNSLTGDLVLANLQYSLLQGVFPSLSFTNTSQFVPTHLTNATYANVTGGQTVELLSSGGAPQVITGNKTVGTFSSTDLVCLGGIVHVVDTVLSIPTPGVVEISEIPLAYFISILDKGGYLSLADGSYVGAVLNVPDVTYLIPNSATALANFATLAATANASELEAVYQYHFIPGWVGYGSSLKNGMKLKTAQGNNVSITLQGGEIYFNAAKVIASDYLVANGVVHVIDDFLNRFDTSGPPAPTSASAVSTSGTTPTPSSASSSSATRSPSQATGASTKSTSGTTIGIAVGVSIAGLAIIGASAWFLLRKRKLRRESRVWDQGIMSSGKFVLTRGQVRRQEDLGLGLQSTAMGMGEIGSTKSLNEGSRRAQT